MNPELHTDILARLGEFEFKEVKGWLQGGRCPQCNKKELYTHAESPWVVRCNRLNNCGYEASVKDLYPDLFDSWSTRYQPKQENNHNPNAAADAYLSMARGFDLDKIKGWYSQESYFDHRKQIGSATVRFPACGSWWERLIDQPGRFGSRKAGFAAGSKYKGLWWCPPAADLTKVKEIWIVEGIFNAIALWHHGITAVSIMSCTNYPDIELARLLKMRNNIPCALIWALDNDDAGRSFTKKHVNRATDEGWLCSAAQIPAEGRYRNRDWNDLHLLDKNAKEGTKKYFSQESLDEYRYHGKLLIASSPTEKALLMFNHDERRTAFDFAFGNRLYWFEIDVEKYHKAMNRIAEEDGSLTQDELRERALAESKGLRSIANCLPVPLYYQENKITDESWYYYRVSFPHDGQPVKNTFTAGQISTASEFKKRLLSIAPGAVYTGSNMMLERAIERQLFNIKRVETVDYIGYSKEYDAYVLGGVAIKGGNIYELNKEDYFDIDRLSLKSLNQSVHLAINTDPLAYKRQWSQHLWTAFGVKGFVALAYWFGSLFAEQIRESQKSYPFLEVVGEAGAGKSTLIEFLWKLFGRVDYEGFDPSKSSLAARARNFAQVSGLPVVLIESDREQIGGEKSHVKSFDWDELKTAYNGRSVRARGMATAGNETYEPPFRGAIVISQNQMVNASEAILQRICHLYFDRSGQNEDTRAAAYALEQTPVAEVSGFILAATKKSQQILEIINEKKQEYSAQLNANPKIRTGRLAHNHGQLMALVDALRLVLKMNDSQYSQIQAFIESMAIERQEAINDDHPVVQEFWDLFDYLNGEREDEPKLNHSKDPAFIAINLNEFIQLAVENRQQVPTMRDLKMFLKTSRKHKYEGQQSIYSVIKAKRPDIYSSTSIRCWVFRRGK